MHFEDTAVIGLWRARVFLSSPRAHLDEVDRVDDRGCEARGEASAEERLGRLGHGGWS